MRNTLRGAALLLAAAPCWAASAPAPKLDVPVSDSEKRLVELCAAGSFDVDSFLEGAASRGVRLAQDEATLLAEYAVCQDDRGAQPGCAALNKIDGRWASSCESEALQHRFIFAVLRGGDAPSVCRSLLRAGRPDEAPGAADKVCAALSSAARAGRPDSSCPTIVENRVFSSLAECRAFFAYWSGSEQDCPAAPREEPTRQLFCRGAAGLIAGLRDPSRCESSPYCRAMQTKAAEACRGARSEFAAKVCARARLVKAELRGLEQKRRRDKTSEQEKDKSRQDQIKAMERAAKARKDADAEVELKKAVSARVKAQAEADVMAKKLAAEKAQAETKAKMDAVRRKEFRKGEAMKRYDPQAAIRRAEKGRRPKDEETPVQPSVPAPPAPSR